MNNIISWQSRDDINNGVSLLAFIPTNPSLLTDIECASQLTFHTLNQLIPNNFNDTFKTLTYSLENEKRLKFGTFVLIFGQYTFKMQVLLLVSLKYRKHLFVPNKNDLTFLHHVIAIINKMFLNTDPMSLHLLKLLELLLIKRKDLLTADGSLLMFEITTKAMASPIFGFKNCAKSIKRMIVKSLPLDIQSDLRNIQNWPTKDLDLNDAIQLLNNDIHRDDKRAITEIIVELFRLNTSSRDAGLCYKFLIKYTDFDEFCEVIWPYFQHALYKSDEEGEFFQSLLKYWIPFTVAQYRDTFYTFLRDHLADFKIRAHTLYELKKQGFCNENFSDDILLYFQYSRTSQIGLKLISTFVKKSQTVVVNASEAVTEWLDNYHREDINSDIIKSLKRFMSQIFLTAHIELYRMKSINFHLYYEFLRFIARYGLTKLQKQLLSELSTELLKMVWDIASGSSKDLVTMYKIGREDFYSKGENLFYKHLQESGFWEENFGSDEFSQAINLFPIHLHICQSLADLIIERYLSTYKLEHSVFQNLDRSVSAGNSETIKLLTSIEIAYDKQNNIDYSPNIEELCGLYCEKIGICEEEEMFYCVCVLEVLILIVDDYQNIVIMHTTLDFIRHVIENELHTKFDVKIAKIFETLVNNVLDYLLQLKHKWCEFKKNNVLQNLYVLIQRGNMKKPVTKAINALQQISIIMNDDTDNVMKLVLLDKTLNFLTRDEEKLIVKIRRNPETRLVIHALCVSNERKGFLPWAIHFMLNIISDDTQSSQTLTSTLNSLELLISDNILHRSTIEYTPAIINHCIRLYNNTSWTVRNANIQIMKALVDRFFGISLGIRQRTKNVEYLFSIFPSLIPVFFEYLEGSVLENGCLVILLFISESQLENTVLSDEDPSRSDILKLRESCLTVVKNHCDIYGLFAISSFAALCTQLAIPEVSRNLTQYIKDHFLGIKKNILTNLFLLLKELYGKSSKNDTIIATYLNELVAFLRPYNMTYFDMIFLRVLTYPEVFNKMSEIDFPDISWEERVWLNNNVIFTVENTPLSILLPLLQDFLLDDIPTFLHEQIVSILADRLTEPDTDKNLRIDFRCLFILKVTSLKDFETYLITMYSKMVFLLNKLCNNCDIYPDSLLSNVRTDCKTNSLYKYIVYSTVLSNIGITESEKSFARSFFKLSEIRSLDDDYLSDVAENLIFLYKCCADGATVINTLKLCFYSLLKECSCFEACQFVSWLTKSRIISPEQGLSRLLNLHVLTSCLGNRNTAMKFLVDLRCFTYKLKANAKIDYETFYEVENEFWLELEDVRDLINASLENCNTDECALK